MLDRPERDYDNELSMGLYRYARENLALVNVYIKDPAVTQVKRDQKVPLIWFVANIGGILVSQGFLEFRNFKAWKIMIVLI